MKKQIFNYDAKVLKIYFFLKIKITIRKQTITHIPNGLEIWIIFSVIPHQKCSQEFSINQQKLMNK